MRTLMHSIAGFLFRRTPSLVAGMAILSLIPMAARADDLVRVPWEGLSMTIGKTVLVATPRGPAVTGKVTAVEPDALVVHVTKTNDPSAHAKGELRVSRATLRVVRMQTKGVLYRAAGAFLGAGAGFVSGTAAAIAIDWHGRHDNGARALIVGGGAAGIALGYLAGNHADRRWTTIEILPWVPGIASIFPAVVDGRLSHNKLGGQNVQRHSCVQGRRRALWHYRFAALGLVSHHLRRG